MTSPIVYRTVDKFPEPLFTDLVTRLLFDPDRAAVSDRLLERSAMALATTTAQQVRVGAYADETLVGWSHAYLHHGAVLFVANSAVLPEYRRQGVYKGLVAAVEAEAIRLGCLRVESLHQTTNSAVLVAKLKAGYTIVGTEFRAEGGLLLMMSKQLQPSRQRLMEARAGGLEGTARFFAAKLGG